MLRRRPVWCVVVALLVWASPPAAAQADSVGHTAARPRVGAEFRIPLGSFLIPGIGQYMYGRPVTGAAFTGATVAGLALYGTGDPDAVRLDEDLPRQGDGQRAFYGLQLAGTAGGLSAYEAFRTALPALRAEGKYQFLREHESTAALFTAPFDLRFLTRWTTWLQIAYTGALTALVAADGIDPGKSYRRFTAGDAVFATGISFNAGLGEEALFRGWLYPLLYENLGPQWLANPIQAGIFGALHPQAGPFAVVIAGWAFYEGWLTRRNGWSVRESIFHHFWYDVSVITASLLTDEAPASATLVLPSIRF